MNKFYTIIKNKWHKKLVLSNNYNEYLKNTEIYMSMINSTKTEEIVDRKL